MPPAWLEQRLINALDLTARRSLAWGQDARGAAQDVRERLLGLWPALPLTMVDEAVAWIVGDPEGLTAAPPCAGGRNEPRPATREELTEALSFALRFGADGKPRRTGHEFLASLAAAQLTDHLMRSRFRILREPPVPAHGRGW